MQTGLEVAVNPVGDAKIIPLKVEKRLALPFYLK
jgi:hypothetical protein